jgi:C1A family cysteine protease
MNTPHIHNYGWKRDIPSPFDPVHEHLALSAAPVLPESDMRPAWPPIYDQGALGSCTGNGLGGAVHYVLKKESKIPDTWRPARNFIYWNERAAEGTVGSDAGASIRDGVRVIQHKGVPDEKLWPYDVQRFTQRPGPLAFSDALKHRALAVGRVNQTHTDIRTALSQGYNVVFGFSVFESFESDAVAANGIVPMPRATEDLLGGHCAVLVGHSDARKRYIGRNSWGEDWGIKGYFEIPYEYIEDSQLASDMWIVKVVS